ncbi:hypothetical protein [Frigidibacter sp. ROC022]|uniref:hypothetical protein n=1 Tax=Frigidibacter sp. ROC022 TaxID=2971796 RepID=UPI00215AB7F4|nr:hypothetical protein [Frigidibacter sp. ROC022]MCR8722956.1 hypothetical protein [Frigidibacter sp. ROC022]
MRREPGLVALLGFCAALAGCGAGPGGPAPGGGAPRQVEPTRTVLYEQTVTVEMSDRSFCTGPRGSQGRSWQGRLQGCPHLWPFQASLPPGRVTRLVLHPGTDGAAQVVLTGPDGRARPFSGG